MQSQMEARYKKRVPCDLLVAGSRHPGIVLNLSRSGLFVQTSVAVQRGDWLAIDLNSEIVRDAIGLDTVVMWNRKVAAQLRGVRHGGVGLHIRNAGRGYYDLLSEVSRQSGATSRAGTVAPPGETSLYGYRVRVRLREKPRSKTLLVSAKNDGEARSRALAGAGTGVWEILDVERLPSEADGD